MKDPMFQQYKKDKKAQEESKKGVNLEIILSLALAFFCLCLFVGVLGSDLTTEILRFFGK